MQGIFLSSSNVLVHYITSVWMDTLEISNRRKVMAKVAIHAIITFSVGYLSYLMLPIREISPLFFTVSLVMGIPAAYMILACFTMARLFKPEGNSLYASLLSRCGE